MRIRCICATLIGLIAEYGSTPPPPSTWFCHSCLRRDHCICCMASRSVPVLTGFVWRTTAVATAARPLDEPRAPVDEISLKSAKNRRRRGPPRRRSSILAAASASRRAPTHQLSFVPRLMSLALKQPPSGRLWVDTHIRGHGSEDTQNETTVQMRPLPGLACWVGARYDMSVCPIFSCPPRAV